MQGPADNECPICYTESVQLMQVCENEHKICKKCVFSLERRNCPFCKESFKIVKSKENASYHTIVKGEVDAEHEQRARAMQVQREHQQIQNYYQHVLSNHHLHHQHQHNHNSQMSHMHHQHNQQHMHHLHHLHNLNHLQHLQHSQNSHNHQLQQNHFHHRIDIQPTRNQYQEEQQDDFHTISDSSVLDASQIGVEVVIEGSDDGQYHQINDQAQNRDPQERENQELARRLARKQRDQHMYNQHVREVKKEQKVNPGSQANYKEEMKKQTKNKEEKQTENNQKTESSFLSQIGNFLIKMGQKLTKNQPQKEPPQPKQKPSNSQSSSKEPNQPKSSHSSRQLSAHIDSNQANTQHRNVQTHNQLHHQRIHVSQGHSLHHQSQPNHAHQCTNPNHNHNNQQGHRQHPVFVNQHLLHNRMIHQLHHIHLTHTQQHHNHSQINHVNHHQNHSRQMPNTHKNSDQPNNHKS